MPVYAPTAAATVAATQVEVDAGATPVDEIEVTITDAAVTTSSKIFVSVSMDTPTSKDSDDVSMDAYVAIVVAEAAGSFIVRFRSLDGPVHDRYLLNYLIA